MATVKTHSPKSFVQHCPWRLIHSGLNIEGLCTNSLCPAYNQMVIINLGFGEFDHARIILQRSNKCPMCKNKIHPIKYALNKCQWWYVDHYGTDAVPLNKVNDTYELNDLLCEYTIMEIMPFPKNNRLSQEIVCPICLINIENGNDISHLRCLHSFHRTCIDSWMQSEESMANKCPICRDYIVTRN